MFQIHTRKKPLENDVDLEALAEATDQYSGAEIAAVCNEAALRSLEETLAKEEAKCAKISAKHFQDALAIVKPRISTSLLKIYDNFSDRRN